MFSFKVIHKDKKSKARRGIITTPHGTLQTPAFIPVGTNATVKSLSSEEIHQTKTEMFFVNTYHTYLRPGDETIKKLGGLHKFMNWDGPIITDSGGFQVFSLGRREAGALVKISDEGVEFTSHFDGSKHFFTPEKSLEIQKNLGSDIVLPLDDCPPYPATKKSVNESTKRTHQWAKRSLAFFKKSKMSKKQVLYGIIQGGMYKDLRIESAKFISQLPFSGFAIGGVAIGGGTTKIQTRDVAEWVIPYLPESKPRHYLGVGEIDDIFEIVERGIDTFDCVMPTRIARMGRVLVNEKLRIKNKNFIIDITKSKYKISKEPLDFSCNCFVCATYSRAYINHLFKTRELLGYRLATFHNVYFIQNLVAEIQNAIEHNTFQSLKNKWL